MKKFIFILIILFWFQGLVRADTKVSGVTENTDPQLTDGLYWVDDIDGTPTSNYIDWGTLLDDTKGNGDTTYIWSADKIYDQLALKQDLHASLTSIAGLTEADVSVLECTADDTYGVVTSGGNNYILGSNSDNSALEFKTIDSIAQLISAGTITWSQLSKSNLELTDFADQTAWRIFYSDTNGDITELALGAANTFLGSDGTTSAPSFQALADADIPSSIDPDKIGTDGTANDKIEAGNLNIQSVDLDLTTGSYWWGVGGKAAEITGANVLADLREEDADIWQCASIGAGAFLPDGTNCEAVTSGQINGGPNVYYSSCDGATDGQIEFTIPMPENWDGGGANSVKVGVHWIAMTAGTNTQTVIWESKVQARGHQDTVNNTWTTADSATTTFGAAEAQYDIYYTEITIDEAIGGVGGDTLFVYLNRNADTDTDGNDIYIVGAKVMFQVDSLDEDD